ELGRPRPVAHPRRPGRRRLPAPDLHEDRAGSADPVLRGDRAPRRAWFRRRELQGAVRGDRARAGLAREPLTSGTLDTSLLQAASLERLEHRPWPPPQRPWTMGQTWEDLLFAHWRVDPELLRPRI